jgi:hypothetical protein
MTCRTTPACHPLIRSTNLLTVNPFRFDIPLRTSPLEPHSPPLSLRHPFPLTLRHS